MASKHFTDKFIKMCQDNPILPPLKDITVVRDDHKKYTTKNVRTAISRRQDYNWHKVGSSRRIKEMKNTSVMENRVISSQQQGK